WPARYIARTTGVDAPLPPQDDGAGDEDGNARAPPPRCGTAARRSSVGGQARPGNQMAISRAADSGESEPWTMFCCTFRPQSRPRAPRIVPGAAAVGAVAAARERKPAMQP